MQCCVVLEKRSTKGDELVKLTTDEVKKLILFQQLTGVAARDILELNNEAYFIVGSHDMGRAIGKNGRCVELVKKAMRKNVVIMEHADSPEEFLRKVFGNEIVINRNNNKIIVEGAKRERRKVVRMLLARHFGVKVAFR